MGLVRVLLKDSDYVEMSSLQQAAVKAHVEELANKGMKDNPGLVRPEDEKGFKNDISLNLRGFEAYTRLGSLNNSGTQVEESWMRKDPEIIGRIEEITKSYASKLLEQGPKSPEQAASSPTPPTGLPPKATEPNIHDR